MGPTASGKTAKAIELVNKYPCEIISVDSSMVYKGMDIGTAKPSKQELAVAPHHLIDIRDPKDTYSAADFREDALEKIEEIFAKNKIPLLVGGTMLYFNILINGISDLPKANQEIRNLLQQEIETNGLLHLYKKLIKIDPDSAKRIKPNDKQRIQRALELYEITGLPMTELLKIHKPKPLPYKSINYALMPTSKEELQKNIEKRLKEMLKNGFIEEVEILHKREDLTINTPAMRAVGYRQIWQYLDGDLPHNGLEEKIIIATRQLAKRQTTWLNNWPNLKIT
ncbi:MAG: tRNA (adenosine(37)-N6)-dimethylallyltransferase MiaA [Gammaproteobacteria bacterium]|nr:tRNA (adenosine(37)-N6)-dimethylallyltransferase MiaA [Gammaproteobacteria bacterium]